MNLLCVIIDALWWAEMHKLTNTWSHTHRYTHIHTHRYTHTHTHVDVCVCVYICLTELANRQYCVYVCGSFIHIYTDVHKTVPFEQIGYHCNKQPVCVEEVSHGC